MLNKVSGAASHVVGKNLPPKVSTNRNLSEILTDDLATEYLMNMAHRLPTKDWLLDDARDKCPADQPTLTPISRTGIHPIVAGKETRNVPMRLNAHQPLPTPLPPPPNSLRLRPPSSPPLRPAWVCIKLKNAMPHFVSPQPQEQ